MKKQPYIRPQAEIIRLNIREAIQQHEHDNLPHGSGTVDSGDIEGKKNDFDEDDDELGGGLSNFPRNVWE